MSLGSIADRRAGDLTHTLRSVAVALAVVLYGVAGWVIWVPSLDDARFVPTVLAPIAATAAVAAIAAWTPRVPDAVQDGLIVAAIASWAPLIFEDDRWSITVMVIYVLAWSAEGVLGPVLAIAATAVWAAGWLNAGGDLWVVAIPCSVLAGSFFVAFASDRIADDNRTRDELIEKLESSRRQLAEAEHERGALAERARFAAEVHDTLAQGFTSIVLLSRVGQRTAPDDEVLRQIEATAVTNLEAARRLVANARPAELDDAPLADALRRQLHTVIGEARSTMTVTGAPRAYRGAVEVAAFRAAQEALLNAQRHAGATAVQLSLHHHDDELVIEVADDGNGFTSTRTPDRSPVSGGQGLQAMRDRVASLGGTVHIDSVDGEGTTVSVRLPVGDPA